MELQELRNEINRIDGEMLALLERRLAVCRTIERIFEPYIVWGTVFVQTKRHSLP